MPRNITVTFEDGSTHVYQGAPDSRDAGSGGRSVRVATSKQVTRWTAARPPPSHPFVDKGKQQAGNLAAGLVRGAGSMARDAVGSS